jgi:ectoine hydroxylase-related dioxygenase (phytanoyl-CoA dioxygenase family)
MDPELVKRGYVVLKQFFAAKTLDLVELELQLLRVDNREARLHGIVQNDRNYVVVMNKLDKTSDCLFDIARKPEMLNSAAALLGKAAVPLHVEYFAKEPGLSTPTPPHQDHIFYHEHFSDEPALALWIALNGVSPNSGALEFEVYPKLRLRRHRKSSTLDFDYELADAQQIRFSPPVELDRGDCIAFHSFAVHRAKRNSGASERRAIVFNYRGSTYRKRQGEVREFASI